MKICNAPGCDERATRKGFCKLHYRRWRKGADLSAPPRQMTKPGELLAFIDANIDCDSDECVMWPYSINPNGYPSVVGRGGEHAHRVMCRLAHGDPPTEKHHAAHTCGKAGCVNPNHLYWATPEENQADRIAHGTSNHGEKNPDAKLTDDIVLEARRRYSLGTANFREMASEFGVTDTTMANAVRGRTWPHLPNAVPT